MLLRLLRIAFLCAQLLALRSDRTVGQVTSTWNGTTGNWSDATRWSTNPLFPNNGNGGNDFNAIINGGTVTLDQNIAIATLSGNGGTVILVGGNLLTVGDNTFTTFSGNIEGSGSLMKVGSGGLTLVGINSYSGLTTIDGGTLSGNTIANGGSSSSFGAGSSFSIRNGGVLDYAGTSTASTNRTISLDTGGGSVAVTNSNAELIISGLVSGTGGLTKSGSGRLKLFSVANTYAGGTTIDSGTLHFDKLISMPSAGDVAVNSSATLALSAGGTGQWTNGTSGGGTIGGIISGTGGQGTANQITWNSGSFLEINTGGALIYGGVIGDFRSGTGTTRNDVGLSKLGAGKLTLSGSNIYSGGTLIRSGTLQFAKTTAMPSSGDVTVSSSAILAVNVGGASDWTNGTSGGGGTIGGLIAGTGGQGTLNQITWNSGSRLAIDTTNTLGNSITYGGVIGNFRSGAGTTHDNVGLDKLGFGKLTLAGNNSYSGSTNIVGGTPGNTLQFAKTTAMPAAAPVSVGSLATLAVNVGGAGEWTNGTSGGGTLGGLIAGIGGQGAVDQITWDNSVSVLGIDTTNSPGGTLTYSGTIGSFRSFGGSTTNNVRLTKLGSGTLELTGANTYTGGTIVSAGTLLANNTSGSATGSANVNVVGGTLGGTGTIGGSVGISSGGHLAPGAGAGTLFATGGANLSSGAVLNYDLANVTTVGAGVNDLFAITGNLTLGSSLTVNINAFQGDLTTGIYKLITYTGGLIGNASGLNIVSNNTTNSYLYSFSSATPGEIQLIVADPIIVATWNGETSASWDTGSNWTTSTKPASTMDVVLPTPIPSTGATITLTTGENVRTLNINDNYTLSGGDLNVSTGSVNVATGKTATVETMLTGSAGLTKAGSGTLVLNNSNTYTGGTVVNAGVLQIGSGGTSGTLGTGNILIGSGATLDFNRLDSEYSYGGIISGNGSLTKHGAGTLTLSGSNSYSGLTTIYSGTLQFANTNSMTSPAPIAVGNGATLAVNVGGAGEWTNGTSGGGTLGGLMAGIGGQGTVDQVAWSNGSALGIDTTNAPGGVFTYSGTFGNFYTFGNTTTNNVGLTKLGSGTLALTGTSVYSGNTIINEGELSVTDGGNVTTSRFVNIGYDSGSDGSLSVGGGSGSSSWTINGYALTIGFAGTGTLNITGGGTVSSGLTFLGQSPGSNGTANVGGGSGSSTWTLNGQDLNIGYLGATGTMNVTGGGTVSSARGLIGPTSGSSGTVNVGGGTGGSDWTTTGPISVGSVGTGAMYVTGGGTVSSDSGYIGSSVGSNGIVNVGGGSGSSTWTTNGGELEVGSLGTGTMNISGGGTVSSGSACLGCSAISTMNGIIYGSGTVNVGGGTGSAAWAISGSLTIGSDLTTGTLDIKTNGLVSATGPVMFGSLGKLSGTGTIAGNVTTRGRLAPGNSPGIITIDGDLTQAADSVLEIEVGGLTPGTQHDQVIVTGIANLGGTYEFPIINGFEPQLNDEITFLTAASVNGKPNALLSPNLEQVNPNLGFQVIKNSSDLRLRFVDKGAVQFVDNTGGAVDPMNWNEAANWEDNSINRVPESSDVVSLSRVETGDVMRVEVKNDDAYTYELTVEDISSAIEIAVTNGHTLSAAVGDVTIGDNATITLGSTTTTATLAAAQNVQVLDGGTIRGNGTVVGESLISGSISPGFSVGHLDFHGDLGLTQEAMVVIEIENDTTFDTLSITGDANLGGTLTVSVPNDGSIQAGDSFEIITAGDILGTEFDDVITEGADGLFLAPVYSGLSVALFTYNDGDMNRSGDGTADQDDVPAFALALTNPKNYRGQFGISAKEAGDIDGDGDCDVDDIDDFADLLGMPLSQLTYQMQLALAVPEPSTGTIVLIGLLLIPRRIRQHGGCGETFWCLKTDRRRCS